eukprot:8224549-Pyramimonas_sp.AAC.2
MCVARAGPLVADRDCLHASSKKRSSSNPHATALHARPPPPARTSRVLARADTWPTCARRSLAACSVTLAHSTWSARVGSWCALVVGSGGLRFRP